uniref:Stathmin n=2 Tax=Gadus morhua TaxID=8049 RepID=A0A8C5FUQ3_GADMO
MAPVTNHGLRCLSVCSLHGQDQGDVHAVSYLLMFQHTAPSHQPVQYEGVQAQTQSVNKRASGQAFEVYLEAPMDPSPDKPKSKAPLRKELSLEQLQQRLGAADQRRKSQEAAVLQQLAEKREHEQAVLRKALEESRSFSRRAEEKLSHKLEVIKENREAHLNALKQRLQQKEAHAAQVRRNKEAQSDYSG